MEKLSVEDYVKYLQKYCDLNEEEVNIILRKIRGEHKYDKKSKK